MSAKSGKIVPKNHGVSEPDAGLAGIAAALKSARKEYGLTQQQVADLSGVSDRTVRSLEQGSSSPSLKTLLAVADTLGLKVEVATQ